MSIVFSHGGERSLTELLLGHPWHEHSLETKCVIPVNGSIDGRYKIQIGGLQTLVSGIRNTVLAKKIPVFTPLGNKSDWLASP